MLLQNLFNLYYHFYAWSQERYISYSFDIVRLMQDNIFSLVCTNTRPPVLYKLSLLHIGFEVNRSSSGANIFISVLHCTAYTKRVNTWSDGTKGLPQANYLFRMDVLGAFTIINIYVLVQRVLIKVRGGAEAS